MPTAAFVVNRNRIRHFPRLQHRSAAAAAARGWEIELLETRSADAGDGATRQAVAAGAQLVFAVGGDGTVRACAQALADSKVPLAIVPRGTANLVATALGIPSSLGAALDVGFGQHERRIDLAIADGTTYAAMAGIGLDAAVVGATAAGLKGTAGWLGPGLASRYASTVASRSAATPGASWSGTSACCPAASSCSRKPSPTTACSTWGSSRLPGCSAGPGWPGGC